MLHAGFIVIGVITNVVANVLPTFSRQWFLTDSQSGFFFTAQYLTSSFGMVAISWLLPRFGFSRVLAFGYLSMTIGMLFLGVSPWMATAFFVAVNGWGYGLCNPTTNLRGTELPSKNVAAAVTLLNFSWTIGAVACPFLVRGLTPYVGLRGFSIGFAVPAFALCLAYFFLRVPPRESGVRVKHTWSDWRSHILQPRAIALLALFVLYVGTEVSVGGWVATRQARLPNAAPTILVATSFFYGMLLVGRGLSAVALHRISSAAISIGGLILAVLGISMIAFSSTRPLLFLGAAIAGFGCAPQYPILVTWLSELFKKDSEWMGALYFSGGGFGGAVLPWIVGIVATRTNSLSAGFLVPLLAGGLMILLALRVAPRVSESSATVPLT